MQGAKKTLVLAAIGVAILMCMLSFAKAEEIGQSKSPLTVDAEVEKVPGVCPGEGANTLKKGWLIIFRNTCPTDTISVAIEYQTAGKWREVGYWTLKPQQQAPVALTDNRIFVFYAKSTTKIWDGDQSAWFKPCTWEPVLGGKHNIADRNFGTYIFNFRC